MCDIFFFAPSFSHDSQFYTTKGHGNFHPWYHTRIPYEVSAVLFFSGQKSVFWWHREVLSSKIEAP